mmetsp:Transcript_79455/g.220945  ORF Transcript_79455/g.220945 Transcript_79455/m.220945 type:complete len:193 (+) Transcript_79455:172-750(+)
MPPFRRASSCARKAAASCSAALLFSRSLWSALESAETTVPREPREPHERADRLDTAEPAGPPRADSNAEPTALSPAQHCDAEGPTELATTLPPPRRGANRGSPAGPLQAVEDVVGRRTGVTSEPKAESTGRGGRPSRRAPNDSAGGAGVGILAEMSGCLGDPRAAHPAARTTAFTEASSSRAQRCLQAASFW